MQGHSQCSSGSGEHEDANSDGAMLSRDGEARSCPGADLVSICRGSWALLSLLLWCGDWFFPKVELCDFEGDPK